MHWKAGSCTEGKHCAFIHGGQPAKERSSTAAAKSSDKDKPDPGAKAKAGAKDKAKGAAKMTFFNANLVGGSMMPISPKTCASDFSRCLAGGNTQSSTSLTKKVAFHKCQARIASRQEKAPTHTRWNLGNPEFVPSKTYSDEPWFRGDKDPIGNFGDLDEITWYEERAQGTAYRLFKEINSLKELAGEDFFVANPSLELLREETLRSNLH